MYQFKISKAIASSLHPMATKKSKSPRYSEEKNGRGYDGEEVLFKRNGEVKIASATMD
jgi:hypothetical protein